MNNPSIYIGMSLTHATHQFREKFGVQLPCLLERGGFSVIPFVGLTDGTAEDVYALDTLRVRDADFMLAVCDMPSIGLGMEIVERIVTGKPLIVAWKRGTIISRMVTGAIVKHGLKTCAYNDIDDIVRICADYHTQLSLEHAA